MNDLIRAFQQLEIWKTQQAPADWQAGPDSTAWAPMDAAIQHAVGNAGASRAKGVVYAQVLNLLDQAAREIAVARSLGPIERRESGGFIVLLQSKYRALADL